MVLNGLGQVLLGRRAKDPNRGKWIIPGGGVRWGETWRETAAREIHEETGLVIRLPADQRPWVHEIIGEDEHRVIMYGVSYDHIGDPVASSDLSEVRFFARGELPYDVSPHTRTVLCAVLGWTAHDVR